MTSLQIQLFCVFTTISIMCDSKATKDILRDGDSIYANTIVGKMVGFEYDSILNYDSFD